jgi:titin
MRAQRHVDETLDRPTRARRAAGTLLAVGVVVAGVIALPIAAAAATVPDPPTIGTATPGVASISVAFTAPLNDGGSAITGYDATCTSSNGGAAGVGSGTVSPIAVSPLTNGATYTCTVTATNGIGTSSPSGSSNTAVPATVPDPPVIGTATSGVNSVSVAFTPPADNGGSAITGYTADCASSDGGAPGTNADVASPIVVSSLSAGKTYTCAVLATNAVGSSSESAASNAVVVPPAVPGAPSITTIAAGNGQLSVAFAPPSDNGGSAITSYEATCLSSDGGGADIEDGPSSPIVVGPLTNGKSYTCTVTATNGVGTGPASSPSGTFVPATLPGSPVIGTATGGFGSVSVAFSPPPSDGGSPITSYTASCRSSSGGVPGTASGASSPIVVSPLSNGASYTCWVTATNAIGTGSPSTVSNVAVPAVTVPDPPVIGTATPDNATVNVAFTPAANGGGSAVTEFDATCTSSDGGDLGTGSGASSPVAVTPVTNGSHYTCTVTATNGVGTSLPSATSNVVVPAGPPDAPTLDSVTSGVASLSIAFEVPGSDEGSAITGYTAECDSSTGVTGVASGAASPIVVSPLTNGATYTCTVSAINALGTSAPGGPSDPAVPATVPDAPVIGTALPFLNGIIVQLSPPAFDGGSPLISQTARCVPVGGGAVTSHTKPDPTATFIFVSAIPGKVYTCSVSATNAVGTGSASAASNPVSAATVPGAPSIGTATGGNASASVAFSPPTSNGGMTITSYTATCTSSNGGATGSASGPSSPIVVTSLSNGKTYTCTVAATNAVGTGPASAVSNSVVLGPVAPGAPTIGTATGGNASATVAFTAPASNGGMTITSYTATCTSSNGGAMGSASGPSSPVVVGSLTNGKTYTCTVTATNIVGTGPASGASNAVTPATTVPGAPVIGAATRGNGSVSVAFSPPSTDGGSPITSFNASCTSSDGGVSRSGSSGASPVVVSGLTNGKTYTCKVTATNAVGTGPVSAASNAFVPATVPGAPTIGVRTPGNASLTVGFTAPTNNGGSAITSYTARCVSSNGGVFGSATGGGTPITVLALTNGKTYTCSVTATNAVGQSSASAATVAMNAGAPLAPTGVSATAGAGQATVSWTAPNGNGSAVTGYTITAFVGTTPVLTQTFNSPATTETFTGLTSGTTYRFQVAATNARGTGPRSLLSNAVTPT